MALYSDRIWIKILVTSALAAELREGKNLCVVKGYGDFAQTALGLELRSVGRSIVENNHFLPSPSVADLLARVQQDARIPDDLWYSVIKYDPPTQNHPMEGMGP